MIAVVVAAAAVAVVVVVVTGSGSDSRGSRIRSKQPITMIGLFYWNHDQGISRISVGPRITT